jgi:hypothetical protein
MGIEGNNRRRPPDVGRAGNQIAHKILVAEVNSVKVPDCNNRSRILRGKLLQTAITF